MKIDIKLDTNQQEPKIVVITNKITDEISKIINNISQINSETKNIIITAQKEDKIEIINPVDIIRIYSNNQKVYLETENGEYIVKMRLYEIEEKLDDLKFVRISNSEIINLDKVSYFDFKFVGTICVIMKNNKTTYVSRRCVKKIKEILGV